MTAPLSQPASPLTRKLAQLVRLAPDEIIILEDLQSVTRTIRRSREVLTQGQKYDVLFVLIDGIAIRYRILHDGRRQVLNIALPGDFIGFPSTFFEKALYSVTALTQSVVAPIPFRTLLGLFDRRPRLAAAIFWSFACEAAMYAEHLIDVGRRSALERVSHFLLELVTRLKIIGLADQRSFRMPLTQELIADALGLSVPHVNRTLRQLRDDELVSIEGSIVVIKDAKALSALADFDNSYLGQFRLPGVAAETSSMSAPVRNMEPMPQSTRGSGGR
jgi:CRP-like cAMP-binding protein